MITLPQTLDSTSTYLNLNWAFARMSTPGRPPRRSFGVAQPGDNEYDTPERGSRTGSIRSKLGRLSFGGLKKRPSFVSRWAGNIDPNGAEAASGTPVPERALIPAVMQPAGDAYTTPLPVLSMIVLGIVRVNSCNLKLFCLSLVLGHARRVSQCKRRDTFPPLHGQRYVVREHNSIPEIFTRLE